MKVYNVEFKAKQKFFTNRQKEVLAIIMFPDGKILVSTKEFYPKGIYRLTSGGVDEGETPEQALKRETYEETGIKEFSSEKLAEIYYDIDGIDKKITFETHVFLVKVEEQEIKVIDEEEMISDFKKVDMNEFKILTRKLSDLDDCIKHPVYHNINWADWGRFRKIAHDVVVEQLKEV